MRNRDRICFQTIRSVREISRDDRARIATCSLRTATDLSQANYSVDFVIFNHFFGNLKGKWQCQ